MISKKVSRANGILCRLKHCLPKHILQTLYNSLVLPHFNYGILSWGFTATHLSKLQKRVIRTISNSKYNAHTDPLFKSLGLLKLDDICNLNILKFYFQYCKSQVPSFFETFKLTPRSAVHSYETRRRSSLSMPITRTKFAEKCLRYATPKLINETDGIIIDKVNTHSLQGFCSYIKQYYVNQYEVLCSIPNCYICNQN